LVLTFANTFWIYNFGFGFSFATLVVMVLLLSHLNTFSGLDCRLDKPLVETVGSGAAGVLFFSWIAHNVLKFFSNVMIVSNLGNCKLTCMWTDRIPQLDPKLVQYFLWK
jgi:hypothetical protein